jgi:hypothetical protein
MRIILVTKFQKKSKYILQIMFHQRERERIKRAKELPKARKIFNVKKLMKEPPLQISLLKLGLNVASF